MAADFLHDRLPPPPASLTGAGQSVAVAAEAASPAAAAAEAGGPKSKAQRKKEKKVHYTVLHEGFTKPRPRALAERRAACAVQRTMCSWQR